MNAHGLDELLGEITDLASKAIVSDLSEVKRQALADIVMAIGSVLPVEIGEREGDAARGFRKFLAVAPGVQLARFAGQKEVKLLARRKGSSGGANTNFEIDVDKEGRLASVWREDRLLFQVRGLSVNYSMVECMAIDALKRWFKQQHKRNARRRRKLAAKRAAPLTPEEELADTIKRQKEEE